MGRKERKREDTNTTAWLCTPNATWIWGPQAKHEGIAILVAESEPPDSSPFKHPHFSSQSGGRRGRGDRGTFQAKETLAAAASFKTDLL